MMAPRQPGPDLAPARHRAQVARLRPRGGPHPHRALPIDLASARAAGPSDASAALDEAADLLDADPDAAALLLDGALRRLADEWYAQQGLAAPGPAQLLADLEHRCQPLGWLLRLALRAPDARARLVHAQGLAGAMLSERRARLRSGSCSRSS
jgi:hypothetical protein